MLVWPELKPTTKFGQMPVLRFADGKELAQSTAIARYLSRTSTVPECNNLYPVDDAYAACLVDQYMMAVDEVRAKLVPTFSIPDQAAKEAARAALFAEDGAMFLGFKKIEASLEADDGYMVGGRLSLADLALFCAVNQCRAGKNRHLPSRNRTQRIATSDSHPCSTKPLSRRRGSPSLNWHRASINVCGTLVLATGFMDGVPTDGWLQKLPKLEKIVNNVTAVPKLKAYYAEKAAGNKLFAPHAGN
jgi:glutathione S-transferase